MKNFSDYSKVIFLLCSRITV
uniref:Uncharacterized protein n=1 Tax=Anguilla anguilla TaxID=7936 RepID=A0A0E9UJ69_ANGAN